MNVSQTLSHQKVIYLYYLLEYNIYSTVAWRYTCWEKQLSGWEINGEDDWRSFKSAKRSEPILWKYIWKFEIYSSESKTIIQANLHITSHNLYRFQDFYLAILPDLKVEIECIWFFNEIIINKNIIESVLWQLVKTRSLENL